VPQTPCSHDVDILGTNIYGSSSLDSYLPNTGADNPIAYRGTFGEWNVGATYSPGRDVITPASTGR